MICSTFILSLLAFPISTATASPTSSRFPMLRHQEPRKASKLLAMGTESFEPPQPLSAQEAKRALLELISEFEGRILTDGASSMSYSYSMPSFSFSYAYYDDRGTTNPLNDVVPDSEADEDDDNDINDEDDVTTGGIANETPSDDKKNADNDSTDEGDTQNQISDSDKSGKSLSTSDVDPETASQERAEISNESDGLSRGGLITLIVCLVVTLVGLGLFMSHRRKVMPGISSTASSSEISSVMTGIV
mmetsp:Transcript_40182/g.83693  ORF Transcript_40182/g.83693 Transcript_40182/m.83693 type:complete len:247 (-) Transcript_40182:185-925(-)